jgi:hypothetical protein
MAPGPALALSACACCGLSWTWSLYAQARVVQQRADAHGMGSAGCTSHATVSTTVVCGVIYFAYDLRLTTYDSPPRRRRRLRCLTLTRLSGCKKHYAEATLKSTCAFYYDFHILIFPAYAREPRGRWTWTSGRACVPLEREESVEI